MSDIRNDLDVISGIFKDTYVFFRNYFTEPIIVTIVIQPGEIMKVKYNPSHTIMTLKNTIHRVHPEFIAKKIKLFRGATASSKEAKNTAIDIQNDDVLYIRYN